MPEAVRIPAAIVRRCGPFLLGRRIGAGGMAAVFAARQRGLDDAGRLVAVKIMSTALADDPVARRMFLREASIATRLEHPNVVRVYDVGDAQGELYLAMEFLHGASLSALQRAAVSAPPVAIAARIVCDVARGLHAAHELSSEGTRLGLVHQDVTPQNVMVGYGGSVKLLDFGVARIASLDGSRTDSVRGKPSYLAPEQLRGERIDCRTDVFSLGIVLFELLTATRLFGGQTVAESYLAILQGESVPDVRSRRADLPGGVADVVGRALAFDPEQRFGTAEELRRALEAACSAAGLASVDETDVGGWARAVCPPTYQPAELEREITAGVRDAEVPDVADLPTVVPGQATHAPRRSWMVVAGAVVVTGALTVGALRIARPGGAPPAPVPATAAVTEPAPVEAPATGAVEAPPPEPAVALVPASAPLPTATPARPPVLPGGTSSPPAPPPPPSPPPVSPPPASAAAVAVGHLGVWSSISGRVSVDGVPAGDSPLSRLPVAPGTHTVSVSTASGSQRQTVTVKPGETVKLRFVF